MLKSLDPRINRLQLPDERKEMPLQPTLEQLETYQVFLQLKEGKPYNHVGIVHAADQDVAFLFAKEQFSRRYTCSGLWIVRTQNVMATATTEGETSIYDQITISSSAEAGGISFEVFHLNKRGKQHAHIGTVVATDYESALAQAKQQLDPGKPVYNAWVIKSSDILKSAEEDRDMWVTLPEKKYREAIDYKGLEKIKKFKEEQQS